MLTGEADPKEIERVNKWACELTTEYIKDEMPEKEFISYLMECPYRPRVYGFLLELRYFHSKDHLATILNALMKRLDKVKDVDKKMKSKWLRDKN